MSDSDNKSGKTADNRKCLKVMTKAAVSCIKGTYKEGGAGIGDVQHAGADLSFGVFLVVAVDYGASALLD